MARGSSSCWHTKGNDEWKIDDSTCVEKIGGRTEALCLSKYEKVESESDIELSLLNAIFSFFFHLRR